jgi:acyl-CoA synthetase (AMP-forming)/AMP-acid ligase II
MLGRDSQTIKQLVERSASRGDALLAADCDPISYGRLAQHIDTTVVALNYFGVGRGDSVAFVLPNGPLAASAFLSLSCGATCAPLNPSYRTEEFEFYFRDLEAKALVAEAGVDSPATNAAQKLGIPLLELKPHGSSAGSFVLQGQPGAAPARGGLAEPSDVAMVLHTSGTATRPKIVPLSHRNLCASANNIARTLALTPQDLCLNVMPLFQVHGLIGSLLSSIAAGASVYCTSGFNVGRFFGWLSDVKPSWYSAVPTMHQAILSRASRNERICNLNTLRFIHSSPAGLPPQVLKRLEETFGVPVAESYGMTEAAHQIASNPLPPATRKPGSVGPAAGPEIGIMDDAGQLLAQGVTGEIVIRGDNVTAGYARNPEANASAFTHGWFRTGDQGRLDEDGYLYITGRREGIVNRGGEKISPRQVDEALISKSPADKALPIDLAAKLGLTAYPRRLRDSWSSR